MILSWPIEDLNAPGQSTDTHRMSPIFFKNVLLSIIP